MINNVFPSDVGRRLAGPFQSQEVVDQINEELGTNDPLIVQYGRMLKSVVTLDFGDSYVQNKPVTEVIGSAFWRSLKLAAYALILTIPISIGAGVFAARRQGKLSDRTIVASGLASSSIPEFVSCVILQVVIGWKLGWFHVIANAPDGSSFLTQLSYLTLPALALVVVYFGYIARMELGTTKQIFDGPNHPYTEALLSAVPSVDGEVKPRIPLSGEIPSPANPPAGCVFHTRCHRFIPGLCDVVEPETIELAVGHISKCHLTAEQLSEPFVVENPEDVVPLV